MARVFIWPDIRKKNQIPDVRCGRISDIRLFCLPKTKHFLLKSKAHAKKYFSLRNKHLNIAVFQHKEVSDLSKKTQLHV